MLQRWRNPHSLLISPEGVILNSGDKVSRLVDMQESTSSGPATWSQVLAEWEQKPVSPIKRPIRCIIANSYVRYAVLPWQSDIYSQQDWQSIAENHMRSLYGNVVDNWKISVVMQGYGKPLFISAIDDALLFELHHLATQNHWAIDAIEPALIRVLSQYRRSLKKDAWLMMVESKRVTLLETTNNVITRCTAICPPDNLEQAEAINLLKRTLKSQADKRSATVFVFADAKLHVDINIENIKIIQLSTNKNTENSWASMGEILVGLS